MAGRRPLTIGRTHIAAPDAIRKIDGAEDDILDTEERPNDYMQPVPEREKDGKVQAAVESSEERMGPIMKAIWDKNDRADVANRPHGRRGAKSQKKFALVSGDPVLLKNAQVAASPTAPCAPEMEGVTQAMGAPLRSRSAETGKARALRNEN